MTRSDRQVTAAVMSDDERDALITAASLLVARHADEVEQQLQTAADGVRRDRRGG